MVKKQVVHGTRAAYRAGCKAGVGGRPCVQCRKWKADDTARWRASREDEKPSKRAPKRARPTSEKRPTFSDAEADAVTVRRPSSDDDLAQIIEQALWDARGDEATASVLAAAAVRDAGYRLAVDKPIESAARAFLGSGTDPETRLRHEMVFRGARDLDNGGNYKQTIEAMRQVLADVAKGGGVGDAFGEIVAALRSPEGGGDPPEMGDAA